MPSTPTHLSQPFNIVLPVILHISHTHSHDSYFLLSRLSSRILCILVLSLTGSYLIFMSPITDASGYFLGIVPHASRYPTLLSSLPVLLEVLRLNDETTNKSQWTEKEESCMFETHTSFWPSRTRDLIILKRWQTWKGRPDGRIP